MIQKKSAVITPETGVDISTMVTNINVLTEALADSTYYVGSDGTLDGGPAGVYQSITTLSEIPTSGTYAIGNEAGLQKLAEWLNTVSESQTTILSDCEFVLQGNIIVTDNSIFPIGYYETSLKYNAFGGTFNGGNFTISGIDLNNEVSDKQALFAFTNGAVIKNLKIEGSIKGKANCAGFVASSYGPLTIDNCVNNCDVTSTASNVGGFVGNASGAENCEVKIINCTNNGRITGGTYTGGIIGSTSSKVQKLEIYNCCNNGIISSIGDYVGGIVGSASSVGSIVNIQNCVSTANVSTTSATADIIGAIVGVFWNSGSHDSGNSKFDYCYYLNESQEDTYGKINSSYESIIGDDLFDFLIDVINKKSILTETSSLSHSTDLIDALNSWISDSGSTEYKLWDVDGYGYPILKP